MTLDVLNIFENSLNEIKSIETCKKGDSEYTFRISPNGTDIEARILSQDKKNFKLKLSLNMRFNNLGEISEDIIKMISEGCKKESESACKITKTTKIDGNVIVETSLIFTDYAGVFNEASRKAEYKGADFKIIILSMISEIYSFNEAINTFVLNKLDDIIKTLTDEENE